MKNPPARILPADPPAKKPAGELLGVWLPGDWAGDILIAYEITYRNGLSLTGSDRGLAPVPPPNPYPGSPTTTSS